jgi:parallel beta-helix repeat protein
MRARVATVGIVLGLIGGLPQAAAGFGFGGFGGFGGRGSAILRVDNGTGRGCQGAKFTRIQDAIDAARTGQTIVVCGGTYAEQLVISKKVKIVGNGRPLIKPNGMTANTTSIRTGGNIAAAAVISASATLDGLEFDLSMNGLTNCDEPLLMGVFFRGTSGVMRNTRVHGVRQAPEAGTCATGAGVFVQGNGATPVRVDLAGNVVYDYARSGVVVNERGARAFIRGNTVTGDGDTASVPQAGIQVGFGAIATVTGNIVQNNAGPSGDDCTFDAGNLIFASNGGLIMNNTFTGNAAGIIVNGSSNRMLRNTIDGRSGGIARGLAGISIFGDRNLVTLNNIRNQSQVGIRLSGNSNLALRNSITSTHAAPLCEALRALPGCAEVLATCGVGIWIEEGTGNTTSRNIFSSNDVNIQDDGALTVHRGGGAH